tara:strand:- start:8548 stop:9753 length:1206 start_codon:yes stop_codon:yes gene_type:complete
LKIQKLLSINKKFGSPAYIYDANKIEIQYKKLITAFSKINNLRIHYAVKALSNISILKFMKKLGCWLDTVSIQEVELGLLAGFDSNKIIYTPNGVSIDEIEAVSKLGVQINIDNLSILEQFGRRNPNTAVCVRINPHVNAGGNSNISVGHIDSKFGISIHQIPLLLRIIKNTKMNINGIHMHTGSDILDIEVFLYASEILFENALKFKNLEFIDFGSGFKVPYKKGDIETNIEELGEKLTIRFNKFCKKYGKKIALAFEPGKFLVSEAGYFITSVNSVKQTTSTIFAQINSGFNHFIRPMFYNSYHEIINISNPKGKKRFYSVVGYICETDTFANNREIEEISEGDILVFKNAGAYCFAMANNYNSRPKPIEIFLYNNKALIIREKENLKDILNKQIELNF